MFGKRLSRALGLSVAAVLTLSAVAMANTSLEGSSDALVVGSASTSETAVELDCGGDAEDIVLNVIANNGNITATQIANGDGEVTVPNALSINSDGDLVAIVLSGTTTKSFAAGPYGGAASNTQTLSFTIALSADADAPDGAGSDDITFSESGAGMVNLGTRVDLADGDPDPLFVAPTVFWNVTCASYDIVGFYQPVNNILLNGAKAGSTIPLKFDILLDGVEQSDTSLVTAFTQKYTCESGELVDMLTADELSSGSTSLRWDSTGEQFIFNWKTPKTPGCYRVTVTVDGGDSISADFQLK